MKVVGIVRKVARTDANVLITGENGTGKELIAREIHRLSNRSDKLMVKLDIGSLAESLFEDELFGHKKGAFTDAFEDRVGKIETAHGGTLFIDEIGNLTLPLQAKLLSVIENREVIRLGSNKVKSVDLRLICATNKDLSGMVVEGSFREDLLYRINTIVIEVPPLRDRGDDILLLANFYLARYSEKYNKGRMTIQAKAQEDLMQYLWPGNVRELRHTIEKAVILADKREIQQEDLFIKASQAINMENPITLLEMERVLIKKSIDRYKGNLSAAADELGITRQTLYNKIKKSNS
jgi:DNA-binding NtrC family response regulator